MKDNHLIETQTRYEHDWLAVLEEHHVKYIALDPMHDQVLIEKLENHRGWVIKYSMEEAIIFVRAETLIGERV